MIDKSTGLAFTKNGIDFYNGYHGGYIFSFVHNNKDIECFVCNLSCLIAVDLNDVIAYEISKAIAWEDRKISQCPQP